MIKRKSSASTSDNTTLRDNTLSKTFQQEPHLPVQQVASTSTHDLPTLEAAQLKLIRTVEHCLSQAQQAVDKKARKQGKKYLF